MPHADELASAFERRCADARKESYDELEELRYAWICKFGQSADRERFLSGKEQRAALNSPPAAEGGEVAPAAEGGEVAPAAEGVVI